MKKAIVTGANGFIGSNLVKVLTDNDVFVIAVDRVGTNWKEELRTDNILKLECDLKNISDIPEKTDEENIDCIFHMAWQGVSDSDAKNYDVQLKNITAALELITAAHKMKIPSFVMAGSIHEFEAKVEMNSGVPVTNLSNMYKTAKLAAHWMGKALAGSYGIRFLCPLIINAYGEGENSARLINTLVRKVLNGESPELSDATQLYDFVHVTDVARAFYLIGEKAVNGKEYIIGSGTAKPLKDFLTIAGDMANAAKGGEKIPLGFGKYNGKAVFLPPEAFDTTSLTKDTGFKPLISFEEGIKRTIEWILREHKYNLHQ